jgi:hypothetical protein
MRRPMPKTSLSDHIMVFAGTLSPAHCQTLIDRFESSIEHETCQLESGYSFIQLNITQTGPIRTACWYRSSFPISTNTKLL